jgi:hypothetical protein
MDSSVNERINQLYKDSRERSIRSYAIKIGVAPTTLNECIKGSEPRFSILSSILTGNPSISAEWLMRGTGNMYKNEEASTNNEPEEESEKDRFYQDIISTYQEAAREYRKKIEYLEKEIAKIAPFGNEEKKKESKSA